MQLLTPLKHGCKPSRSHGADDLTTILQGAISFNVIRFNASSAATPWETVRKLRLIGVVPIKSALILPTQPTQRWELAKQMGVDCAVTKLPTVDGSRQDSSNYDDRTGGANPTANTDTKPWDYEPLLHLNQRFENQGFDLQVIEDRPPMDKIRMGEPGRDEEIEEICRMLRNMGEVGIPIWCSSFRAKFNWGRTATNIPIRGGALVSGYDHSLVEDAPTVGNLSEEELWENLEYFLERVGPVAEEAGVKMALHPDDPPVSELRGISRIMTSIDAFDRLLNIYPSEYNGITFGQGNFALMDTSLPEAARHFQDRINFVHFRDVVGTREKFREEFHDNGPTDMLKMMETYRDIGFDGPIRPDHVPTMAGESNDTPGYEMKGRLFAVGYMKGLLEQTLAD